jgi:hypothetical protein
MTRGLKASLKTPSDSKLSLAFHHISFLSCTNNPLKELSLFILVNQNKAHTLFFLSTCFPLNFLLVHLGV